MITLLSSFLSRRHFHRSCTDRRGSDHVYKKPEEKGRGSNLCRLCNPDVWNECHERSCGTSCRGTGVYRNAGEIFQSDPGSCGWSSADSDHPVVLRIGWYSPGTVSYRNGTIQCSTSYYHGTEYRYLYHCDPFSHWSQQKRKNVRLWSICISI